MIMIENGAGTLPQWEFAPCPDEKPDCPGGLACPRNAASAVRAMLQAMREPTEAMQRSIDAHRMAGNVSDDTSRLYWQKMIDAALEED